MPRDGSGIYHRPVGTDGVPNYPIESSKYNAYTADIEQDLNLPRPISAGGTGASNAKDAMVALGGEVAKQLVDNYDSFPFVSGSFSSMSGATSAPVAGHSFQGIAYVNASDPGYVIVEARDINDTVSPSRKYIREKRAGTWVNSGAWSIEGASQYVLKAGDTMTGNLYVGGSGGIAVTGPAGISAGPGGLSAGASGIITTGAIRVGDTTTGGTCYFGQASSGNKYLTYDGANFSLAGGALTVYGPLFAPRNLVVGDATTAAAVTLNGISSGNGAGAYTIWQKNSVTSWYFGHASAVFSGSASNNLVFYTTAGKTALELDFTLGQVIINPNSVGITTANCAQKITFGGGAVQYGIGTVAAVDNTTLMYICNSNLVGAGSISQTATSVAFNTSSSRELKEDLKSFDAGSIIDDTEVYDFKWKSTGERSYGVIAQQAVEVYPTAVSRMQQEGQPEFWGVDYSKYVPVLLQELKALRERVRQLETTAIAQPT